MTGFFTKKETASKTRPDGKTLSCHSCGLYRKVLSPKMKPYGNFKKGIMNIDEAPGETEDKKGKQWQGKSGKVLKNTYAKLGIDLFDDCININAINCRPTKKTGNRTPTPFEVDCCRRIVFDAIKQYKPKVIVLFGGTPLLSVIGNRWIDSLDGIYKWRGFTIPDQDFKAWICPTLHPSFIMRSENNEGIRTVWEQDLKQAISKVDDPFPYYKEPEIKVIKDLSILKDISKYTNTISFDYETTGLKPHSKGHRIVTASVATSPDFVYVFEMPKKAVDRKPFRELLKNSYIRKMGHNCKFETTWSKAILKTKIKNWYWDSMLAAHILDNRKGVTGLKFQTYVMFGIIDYNSTVDKALKADTSNSKNTIKEFIENPKNKEEMLRYNALDSIFQYRLAMLQQKIIK